MIKPTLEQIAECEACFLEWAKTTPIHHDVWNKVMIGYQSAFFRQAERIKELEENHSELLHESSMNIEFLKDEIAALTAQRDRAVDILRSSDGGYNLAMYINKAIAILEGKE